MSENHVIIKKLIVHILDNIAGLPVYSEYEQELDSEITDFISKHISKIVKDAALKKGVFIEGEDNEIKAICTKLQDSTEEFVSLSKKIADILFNLMLKYPTIPPADLVCGLIEINNDLHLSILKFNYHTSFIHYVGQRENGNMNSIIKQKTVLPNENQKVEEMVLINLNDLSIKLLEKKYEIDAKKQFYLSLEFLKCSSDLSEKEKIKILEKTTKKFIENNYVDDDLSKLVTFKKSVVDNIEEEGNIDIENVADKMFEQSLDMREKYIEEVEKKGFREKKFEVNQEVENKNYKKQKIVTDTGIEIKLPIEDFHNKDRIEFINNPDGTISIILKNIKGINDK